MALRSKPEGKFLLLTRLARCRKASGPTADDAVLTLILVPMVPGKPGPPLPIRRDLPEQTPRAGLAVGSVNEAAKPNIHNQTNRQENKQRSGTPVTHERKRDAGHGHSADDHRHVY